MGIFGMKIEKSSSQEDIKKTVDYSKINNLISNDTIIKGDISSEANLRLKGTVTGNVHSKNSIIIEKEGKVKGNLRAPKIDVKGLVEGSINSNSRVHLQNCCKYTGNIVCQSITISGQYQGTINAKKVIITESAKMKGTVITETISIAENPNLSVEFKIKEKQQQNESSQ